MAERCGECGFDRSLHDADGWRWDGGLLSSGHQFRSEADVAIGQARAVIGQVYDGGKSERIRELTDENARLRAALVASDGIVQELRRRHETACSERQRATEMIVDLVDAIIEKASHEERYCTACGYGWRAEQPATDKVHGERCIVEAAERLLKELGA